MSTRRNHLWALALLACWQVLLASADDFNLARFMFSPAEGESEDPLPLDDPNTDFLSPTRSRASVNAGRDRGGDLPAPPPHSAGSNCTSPPALPGPGQLSRVCSNTPLRC